MAKKKKAKSAKRAPRKRTSRKSKVATATRRKSKKKKASLAARSRTVTKKKSTSRAGSTSVDLLLGRFAKQRSTKESQLAALTKKRQELEEKARKFREEIEKLEVEERKSRDEIAQLDVRRDQEVGQLLSKLGVQLGNAAQQVPEEEDAPAKPAGIVKAARDRMRHSLANNREGRR